MGRTNIELDDELVNRAMKLTGAKTKREVVHVALSRLVERGSLYRALQRARGQFEWTGDLDRGRRSRVPND